MSFYQVLIDLFLAERKCLDRPASKQDGLST